MADLKVHPAAAVFPMLSDDELADLAEDIKSNGLRHPIVLDREGRIIDGRNRYAACLLASVEPMFITFDGDVLAYIISVGVNRRDMRSGQKAMALADLLLTSCRSMKYGEKGGYARSGGIAPDTLYKALAVAAYDDLADQVRAGGALRPAYDEVIARVRRRAEAEDTTERALTYLAQEQERALARLEAARSAVGPAVAIPPEPELDVVLTPQLSGEVGPEPAPKLGDNLDRESAFLARLAVARQSVAALADEEPIGDAWYFEGHVMAVRSWASQVIALVYGMVDRYNAALDGDGRLRRVK
jgi:ParB-like chromosome segregation protein Spo0J